MISGLGTLASSALILLSMLSADKTEVARAGQAQGPRCGCAATVAGPDGGTRVLQGDRSECNDTTSCSGSCVYFADSPTMEPQDYELPCLVNEGSAATCGEAACPPPRSRYTLGTQNCIRVPSCDGTCVWKDPNTGYESYDVCR